MRTLPDHLRKGMKLVIVGCNPTESSVRVGHYYAGRGNQFWPIMYESGVIPEPLSYEDDRRMLEFGIGMTDLVKRPTRSQLHAMPSFRISVSMKARALWPSFTMAKARSSPWIAARS